MYVPGHTVVETTDNRLYLIAGAQPEGALDGRPVKRTAKGFEPRKGHARLIREWHILRVVRA